MKGGGLGDATVAVEGVIEVALASASIDTADVNGAQAAAHLEKTQSRMIGLLPVGCSLQSGAAWQIRSRRQS